MAGILVGRGSQSRRLVRPDGLPQCLPRGRPPAGDPLPAPGAIGGPAISRATTAAAGPGARRADPGARGPSLRALHRRGPANGLCHSPRPGRLPGLGLDHVPHPALGRRGPGAASPRPPPGLRQTGTHRLASDITKLLGPKKWTYYYLYVILDIFRRYVVGWMLAGEESAALAERLLAETITKQGVDRDQLTVHADRGSSMASKPVAMLLADLGVTKSHSRPHCPNDNPFSESQFKTMKYRPEFPDRFGGPEDARAFCTRFFPWYNDDHRHSGIAYHTPADVHYGRAIALREQRAKVLTAAYAIHPERFVRKPPEPPRLPVAAWINQPLEEVTTTQ